MLSKLFNADAEGILISSIFDGEKLLNISWMAPKNATEALIARLWESIPSSKEDGKNRPNRGISMVINKDRANTVHINLPSNEFRMTKKTLGSDIGMMQGCCTYEGAMTVAGRQDCYALVYKKIERKDLIHSEWDIYCEYKNTPNDPKWQGYKPSLRYIDLYTIYMQLRSRINCPINPKWMPALFAKSVEGSQYDNVSRTWRTLIENIEQNWQRTYIDENSEATCCVINNGSEQVDGVEGYAYHLNCEKYNSVWVELILDIATDYRNKEKKVAGYLNG